MSLERKAARFLRRRGYAVIPSAEAHRAARHRVRLMSELDIDLVLDVGANSGQFGSELRQFGYRGRIVSFEPQAQAYAELSTVAARDSAWTAINVGLGRVRSTAVLNIAGNSVSSSMLPMLQLHERSAPESAYVTTEQIEVRRLDEVFGEVRAGARKPWLKIDTQGYEIEVLAGAGTVVGEVPAIQVEMSLSPLYGGGPVFDDLYRMLTAQNFALASLEQGHFDPANGRLLQVDGIFLACRD